MVHMTHVTRWPTARYLQLVGLFYFITTARSNKASSDHTLHEHSNQLVSNQNDDHFKFPVTRGDHKIDNQTLALHPSIRSYPDQELNTSFNNTTSFHDQDQDQDQDQQDLDLDQNTNSSSLMIEENILSKILKKVGLSSSEEKDEDSNSSLNKPGITIIAVSTQSPYLQLTAVREPDNVEPMSAGESQQQVEAPTPMTNLSLDNPPQTFDDDTDRHIQYDKMHEMKPVKDESYDSSEMRTTTNSQKLHPRQVSNEGFFADDTLTKQKLIEEPDVNNSSNNYPTESDDQGEEGTEIKLSSNLDSISTSDSPSKAEMKTNTTENIDQYEKQQENSTIEPHHASNSSSAQKQNGRFTDTSAIQARSMSVSSSTSTNLGNIGRSGPHTKPPYATYDTFHHRATSNTNDYKNLGSTDKASDTSNSIANIKESQASMNGTQQDLLVNSIGRISSQLVTESSQNPTKPNVDSFVSNNPEPMSIQSLDQELSREKQNSKGTNYTSKLSTTGKPIDLNPIPAGYEGDSRFQLSNLREQPLEVIHKDNYYFSRDQLNNLQATKQQHLQLSYQNSNNIENKHNNNPAHSNEYMENNKMSGHGGTGVDTRNSQQNLDTHTSLVERDLQSEGGSPVASYQQQAAITDRDRLNLYEQQLQLGSSSSSIKHAASLINVTGPIIPPLSATEAMESSLPNRERLNLLHQRSGLFRPPHDAVVAMTLPSSISRQPLNGHQYSTTTRPPPSHSGPLHYFSQSALDYGQQIYSQPANLFSAAKPNIETNLNSNNNNDLNSLDLADIAGHLEERTRLNRNNFLVNRRPGNAVYVAPPQPTPASHSNYTTAPSTSASGFRSPSVSPMQAAASYASPTSVQPPSFSPNRKLPVLSSLGYFNSASFAGLIGSSSSGSPQASIIPSGIASTPTSSSEGRQQQQHSSSSTTTTESTMHNNTTSTAQVSVLSSSPTRPPYLNPDVSGSVNSTISMGNHPSNGVEAIPSTVASIGGVGIGNGGSSALSHTGGPIFNLTRVEHISAECSNDLIRAIIVFNGTFKGIIYSMNYVRDSNCIYINGTGKNKYEFNIKLNECGTLNRQELHPSAVGGHGVYQRRDQVMQNTLTIQYNPIIEQEWDEHFRVSCEYGSDFWKTISFSPFKVETNTGSPVVFTVNPPQCQMEIVRGHGIGPRQGSGQEIIQSPVTVGDPLTLYIHMRSERAGYDILVKNCIAHNGGHQKMQLIDTNGCVVNERFISPFRGTYTDNDMRHVTLYSYLKAFRFTGTAVLYLECEIHMCQSSCPPQMCYWRRLSKRSTSSNHTSDITSGDTSDQEFDTQSMSTSEDVTSSGVSESTFSHHSRTKIMLPTHQVNGDDEDEDDDKSDDKEKNEELHIDGQLFGKLNKTRTRQSRKLNLEDNLGDVVNDERKKVKKNIKHMKKQSIKGEDMALDKYGQISDKVSLFQALEVQGQEHNSLETGAAYTFEQPNEIPTSDSLWSSSKLTTTDGTTAKIVSGVGALMCYRRTEVLVFLFTVILMFVIAISATVGCCWQAASLRSKDKRKTFTTGSVSRCISSANLSSRSSSLISKSSCSNSSSSGSSSSGASPRGSTTTNYNVLPYDQTLISRNHHPQHQLHCSRHHHQQQQQQQLNNGPLLQPQSCQAYLKPLNVMDSIMHHPPSQTTQHKTNRSPY